MSTPLSDETDFLRLLHELFPDHHTPVGIGDDAAVIEISESLVTTTDTLIEGIDWHADDPVDSIIHRAFTANLSDLAAMGATPHHVLLTLCWPTEHTSELEPLLRVVREQCNMHRVFLVGGDLSSAPIRMISIVANGVLEGRDPLLRQGARLGERIFLSRPVGGAASGLALRSRGWQPGHRAIPPAGTKPPWELIEMAGSLLRAHLYPSPETALGIRLSSERVASSAIDLSDGLSTDLDRLCKASGSGAQLDWDRIPPFPDLFRYAAGLDLDPRRAVLHGGEEYALLFTSSLTESRLSELCGRPVYWIGSIVEGTGVILKDGPSETILEPEGWDHFGERQSGENSDRQ
ncbi:MAG: thiamine-phosphate kinase [Acidobacteria bacterium]|nr:thiamine-phosphate kinase [Acidobacteriota bacterium]